MPITEQFKVEEKEGKQFDPLPENVYQVEVLDINVENRPTYDTKNLPDTEKIYEKVLNFQFVLLSGAGKDGKTLRGRSVFQNFVPTYLYISTKNGKNTLYQISEAILRHELTQEERATMDNDFINGFIGAQLRVGIKQKKVADKTYSNIESYFAIEEGKEPLTFEERENAKVKPKEDSVNIADVNTNQGEKEDIPTINLDDEIKLEDKPW